MLHTQIRVWQCAVVRVLAITAFCVGISTQAQAHVHWTRINTVGPNTAALYHCDGMTPDVVPPATPLPNDVGLSPADAQHTIIASNDTPGSIFDPHALDLPSTITLQSTATITQLDGDLTIECWFKWKPSLTSATMEIGLKSGARILVARDTLHPGNDRFGIIGTHGSFIAAPGFTSWAAIGEEEASLNEWRHLALSVHSTGIHYDTASSHDVYSTGTVGRLYLNGHPTGIFPHTIPLDGLKVHDASRITAVMRGGGMTIDEFTVWRYDWSQNGASTNPFSDGRGPTGSGVDQWLEYESE